MSRVVMEATSDYWKPVFYLLESQGLDPWLVNAKKTIVALEHSILTAVWRMLTHDADYHDLGGDYFTRRDPERAMQRIIR